MGICKGDNRFLLSQTMPFVLIQFLPTRPSLGLLTVSNQQGETALRFEPVLPHSSRSETVCTPNGIWILEKLLFHLYKNPMYAGKTADYGDLCVAVERFYHRKLKFQRYFSPDKTVILQIVVILTVIAP